MQYEGPSSEDLDRFGDDTAYCPHCDAEIWDQAEFCPQCHAAIGGQTRSRPSTASWFHKKQAVVIAIIVLLAFLYPMFLSLRWLMSL